MLFRGGLLNTALEMGDPIKRDKLITKAVNLYRTEKERIAVGRSRQYPAELWNQIDALGEKIADCTEELKVIYIR